MLFKDRLRMERVKCGATQVEFAAAIDSSLAVYQRYEYGKSYPGFKKLLMLRRKYPSLNFNFLLDSTDEV